jgi:hypothetical protein
VVEPEDRLTWIASIATAEVLEVAENDQRLSGIDRDILSTNAANFRAVVDAVDRANRRSE